MKGRVDAGPDRAGEHFFIKATRLLLEHWPQLEKERLVSLTRIGLLRRACLALLESRYGRRHGEGLDLLRWARDLGCPLFDAELDKLAPSEMDAVTIRISCPEPAADLDELYQQVAELEISLRGKKNRSIGQASGRKGRRREGLFFTPPWLADRLAAWVVEDAKLDSGRVLDPACGSGRLLLAVVRRLLQRVGQDEAARARELRRLIRHNLSGVELDPLVAALCRTQFWLESEPELGPVEGLSRLLAVGDAIGGPLDGSGEALDWPRLFPDELGQGSGFRALVVNPPFEVLTRFGKRPGLARYVKGIRGAGYRLALRGNLHTHRLFLERSLDLLRSGGRLAIIMPASFLTDQTAEPLRRHLLGEGWLRRVEAFDESMKIFAGVNQAVAWLAVEKRRGNGRVQVQHGQEAVHELQFEWLEALDPKGLSLPAAPAEAIGLAVRMKQASPGCFSDVAEGRVGEVDQTFFRRFMLSRPGGALLVRGEHVSSYRVNVDDGNPEERWLEQEGFLRAKGEGTWREGLKKRRVVQTGIVNLEARRRMVAGVAPAGAFLGNSVNWWAPRLGTDWPEEVRLGYLLGLLNSLPFEWRFRLTSSNNNINLYEVKSLPLPVLKQDFPAEGIPALLERSRDLVRQSRAGALSVVRQITAGWGAPSRDDRAAAMVIGALAWLRLELEQGEDSDRLDQVLDHMVNWHLGMDEPDLEQMSGWIERRFGKKGRPA